MAAGREMATGSPPWRRLFARAAAVAALAAAALAARPAMCADVAVVSHEPGYYMSLAKHAGRWLKSQRIDCELAGADRLGEVLASAKIVFLIGFNEPTGAELDALAAYRARGGRMVVFYSASPRLASMMGVRPLGYKAASYPGEWSRMDFNVRFPEGCPKSILQTSTVIQRAEAIPGKSRVMATWSDRSGKSTGEAAWLSSAAGYWMTHVLLADGDEALKAQLLAAMVGSVAPKLWNYATWQKRKALEEKSLKEYASRQEKRPGEIHAVWDHSGCGLYPGDWPRTFRLLKANGITDIFVNFAGAGFAHYPSDVLPRSKTYEQEGDQVKACLEAAKGSGVRVHAWILCFTATRGTPARVEALRRKGWCLKTREGQPTEYLDPSNSDVQRYLLRAIDELQEKYKLGGIHLDFVRWYERSAKPGDAAEVISKFVAAAKLRVRRPLWFTTAVLGKYPACVASVGQDWVGWLGSNIVDYVVPMDYTEDSVRFEEYLRQHSMLKTHARKTIVGIGVTANESRLSPLQVINQIRLVRKYNLAGVALFDLDTTLEKQILPYLRLGLW